MGFLSKIIGIPIISKMALAIMKKRAFKPFQIPLEETLEKQDKMLEVKFKEMEGTEIGRKLGIHKGIKLQSLPVTDYGFYEPFYNNPSSSAFMYPPKDYMRVRTSGTGGKEKWFMLPQKTIAKAFRETGIPIIFGVFYDGEKVTLEYGDNFYLNTAPRPFIGGTLASIGMRENPFFNFVPNINLSYQDKIRYFILNYKKIDGAFMLASTLISQIIPELKEPIKLKGLLILDPIVGEVYKDEIEKFSGVTPKTVYGSTETTCCSIPSIEHPLSFIFDWRRGIFEFLHVKKEKVEKEPIMINEVKVGEVYQLLFTSFTSELTRYNIKDAVKCVAKQDNILGIDYPVFKFHSRLEKTICIQNFTRINEDELLTVFKEIKIPFVDFTGRVEIEKGLEFLVIYAEVVGDITVEEIQESVHKQLYEMDKDYRDLVNFFDYVPVKIRIVPRGVFDKYLEEKIAAVPKVDRINMREDEFKRFIQLMEGHQK